MKIGIYDPYLDSLGGGERYVLTLAEFLSRKDDVDIFWDGKDLKKEAEARFDIKMDKIKFTPNIFSKNNSLIHKFFSTRNYDLIFFLSDGSIPFIFSKKGILHFQVPFAHVDTKSIVNKIKLGRFHKVVCNSSFTKKFIDKNYGVESLVVYPPVDVSSFRPLKKRNLILNVGRFTRTLHAKKQEILLDAFKQICPKIKGWELVFTGGSMPDDDSYISDLKKSADNYPIKICNNISFTEIKKLYGEAKIYWHAAGFGEIEDKHPEKMEHFGITTVEAMASGCVPVVFSGGGQKEIITDKVNGFLWEDENELKSQTLVLINDHKIWEKSSAAALKRAQDFSQEKFYEAFDKIISR